MLVQDSFLGSLLVCQWSCGKNCWMKQQSNRQTGALVAIQTGCLGAMHRSQSLTALNRWGMVVFKEDYYLECFKSYDIYKKIK